MDRHGRNSRSLADLVGAHRALEDAVGRDAGIVHGAADILAPVHPVGQVMDFGAGPELALGRASP